MTRPIFILVCATAIACGSALSARVLADPIQLSILVASDRASDPSESSGPDQWPTHERSRVHMHRNRDNAVVAVGRNAHLSAGVLADAVVSVFGSSTSEGEVKDSVVSVFGNTRVIGPVGDSAVAIFGNTYVNSRIDGNAVAVFGSVELGPDAEIDGDVVAVGGMVNRDPQATIHGNIQEISFGNGLTNFEGLRAWLDKGLLYGRMLALDSSLDWAWIIALGCLAFYALLALLFRDGVERCAHVLEIHPGPVALAALSALLLTPLLILLLCITVVGIAVVPLVFLALFAATLFGKVVVLAWLGQRVTRTSGAKVLAHPAVSVLIGGLIVTMLYVVPVLGLLVFHVLAILGLGVVVYTLLLASRRPAPLAPAGAYAGPTPAMEPAPEAARSQASSAEPSAADGSSSAQDSTSANGATASSITAAQPRAGFWIRMGALFVDVLLIGIVLHFMRHSGQLEFLALATYGALMWKLKGTTVGGIVCGLAVVRIDGREIDWATAIVRALGCFLSLAVAGLGFLWIAFDDEKQSWHDKIAGTAVVRVRKTVSLV